MIGDRLALLISESGLNKSKFAELAQIDASYIPKIISGEKTPSDRVITSICSNIKIKNKTINESWLRTGEGEMFIQLDPEDELMEWAGRVLSSEPDDFKRRLVKVLASLDEEQWKVLEAKFMEVAGLTNSNESSE